MKLYVLLASLVLGSCRHAGMNCHGRFNVDPAFTPEMRGNVYESGRRWNEFSAKPVSLKDGENDICTIKPTITGSEVYRHIEAEDGPWNGAVNTKTGNIYLCIDVVGDPLVAQSVLLHEFGHTVDMEHIEEPGVMSTKEMVLDFTQADRTECRRVDACH